MSKKKEKSKTKTISQPLVDFQIESKNLQYTILLRDNEIKALKKDNNDKKIYILNLEAEISSLRNSNVNSYNIEKKLKEYMLKSEILEKKVDKLNSDIINQQKKFEEEKRLMENLHNAEIIQLKISNEAYSQKIETTNQLIEDKKNLNQEINNLKKEIEDNNFNYKETLRKKEIKNEIKFSNLKKKMMDNINQTQSKVTELNIQYMDVSTKLTLLQNHQLLIQLEYQSQQIEELTEKKEALEKKIFELNKDIDIHKEVELSLAEKNKKLNYENQKYKKGKNENNQNENESKISFNNYSNINNNMSLGFDENNSLNTNFNRLKSLEKKVITLEKKLSQKNRDYNTLKDNYDYINTKLKNYEKKYSGLFYYFEDCLNLFFNDEDIKNNKEIFVNIDSLKKCDFTIFSKEEKYTILLILMKYLLPLINSNEVGNNMNDVNFKFHSNLYKKSNDEFEYKKKILNSSRSSINIKSSVKNLNSQSSFDSLPSINRYKNKTIINSNLNPSGMIFENEKK